MEELLDCLDLAVPTPPGKPRLAKCEKKEIEGLKRREKRAALRKAKQRERRRAEAVSRKVLLSSMSVEERMAYIRAERHLEETRVSTLQARFDKLNVGGLENLKVIVALEFMDSMSNKEKSSLFRQINYILKDLKSNEGYNVCLCVAPYKEAFDEIADDFGGKMWPFLRLDASLSDVATRLVSDRDPAQSLMILSPDAEDALTLEDIHDPYNIFVIGGLVDRTVTKAMTRTLGQQMMVRIRKLPIDSTERHPILNVNHVAEILFKARFDGMSLENAITLTCPPRKTKLFRG